MPTHIDSIAIKRFANVSHPHNRRAVDCIGALPRDPGAELRTTAAKGPAFVADAYELIVSDRPAR